jgi:hypothetical protein
MSKKTRRVAKKNKRRSMSVCDMEAVLIQGYGMVRFKPLLCEHAIKPYSTPSKPSSDDRFLMDGFESFTKIQEHPWNRTSRTPCVYFEPRTKVLKSTWGLTP